MGFSRQIQVLPVETGAQWRTFFAIKEQLYRDDPCYVRPLNSQRLGQLLPHRNPFYDHADRAAMIGWEGDRPLGRIVAIVDRLHQQHYGERTGFFGFFESPNNPALARALLEAATHWLAERGCNAIRGPVNPSMKSDFGVLVEGNEYPPYVLMAHTPRYYHDLLIRCGLDVVRTFHAYALHASDDRTVYHAGWNDYEALCKRIRERFPRIKIRTSEPSRIESDIRRINELGDQVRSAGWGFVPFTTAELDHVVTQLRRILQPKLAYLAEVDGELVGYLMAMPDLNWALKRTLGKWDWVRLPQLVYWLRRTDRLRIFGIGVAARYRHSGLAGLLIRRLFDDWSEKYRAWELGWVDSENVRSIRSIQGFLPVQVYKTYRLYQRPIDSSKTM